MMANPADAGRFNLRFAVVCATTLLLMARLAVYVGTWSREWFFHDQFAVYHAMFNGLSLWDAFNTQHGPHRQGLGGVLMMIGAALSGWDGRVDSWLGYAGLCAAAGLALTFKRIVTGAWHLTDVLIPFIILSPLHYETLVLVPNPAHSLLPLALVFGYACALQVRRAWLQAGLLSVIGFVMIFTGFGIFGGVMAPPVLAHRLLSARKEGPARMWPWLAGFAAALASVALFFNGWRFSTAAECFVFPHPRPLEYVGFVGLQTANSVGLIPSGFDRFPVLLPLIAAYGLLLLGIGALAAIGALRSSKTLAFAFLIGAAALFAANTAVGRVCYGLPQQAIASKYAALMTPLIVALYAWSFAQPKRIAGGLVLLLLGGALGSQVPFFGRDATTDVRHYAARRDSWQACWVAERLVRACDRVTQFKIYPDEAPLEYWLDYLQRNRLNVFDAMPGRVRIAEPPAGTRARNSDVIIKGTVQLDDFDRYEVYWGHTGDPAGWQWLSGPHRAEVDAGTLTVWNMGALQPGEYSVRVSAYRKDGSEVRTTTRFNYRPD